MKKHILIVEDERRLAQLLEDYLIKSGFTTKIIGNGEDAVPYVRQVDTSLLLLDVMLPGKDGLQITREIRTFSQVPIIMITARVEEIDRLLGLELGADDYICKPFSFREVVARVKAVIRRANPSIDNDALRGIVMDKLRSQVTIFGQTVNLTAIEFSLLDVMASKPGRIFTRDLLMDSIYPDRRVVSDRTIDSHIRKLRKKIHAIVPDREIIMSVYSVGYKFENPF